MVEKYDPRRHPIRSDLAAVDYQNLVEAARYVEGEVRQINCDCVGLRAQPSLEASIDTQGLYGEWITVYEETQDGWAWGQLATDGYVGWLRANSLGAVSTATHHVRSLRTFRYPEPDLKAPVVGWLSIGSQVTVCEQFEVRGLLYAVLSDGSSVVEKHLKALDQVEDDWVTIAEEFVGTPYLWGGRSSLGLDCSALVQIAAQSGGFSLPRDSDMQEAEAGLEIHVDDLQNLQRGDLIFWKGHVGIVSGPNRLLHANGYTMNVAYEALDKAVDRIASTEWGQITKVRRLK